MGLDPRWLALIEGGTATASVGPSAVLPGEPQDFVVVPLPPSVWRMYSRNRDGSQRLSDEAKKWFEVAIPIAKGLRKPKSLPVKVHYVVQEWIRASADVDNFLKCVRDLLKKAEVVPDDKVGCIRGGSDDYQPFEGGVGVRIWLEDVEPAAKQPKPKRKKK